MTTLCCPSSEPSQRCVVTVELMRARRLGRAVAGEQTNYGLCFVEGGGANKCQSAAHLDCCLCISSHRTMLRTGPALGWRSLRWEAGREWLDRHHRPLTVVARLRRMHGLHADQPLYKAWKHENTLDASFV